MKILGISPSGQARTKGQTLGTATTVTNPAGIVGVNLDMYIETSPDDDGTVRTITVNALGADSSTAHPCVRYISFEDEIPPDCAIVPDGTYRMPFTLQLPTAESNVYRVQVTGDATFSGSLFVEPGR
ncbi:hypothetical protein ACFROC_19370 [Nocardia tengchongensis]|uniref:hypothetical protein n=1 Tax=Nocardia tengchongensis TaxID=2055889 RepID=UPI003682E1FF